MPTETIEATSCYIYSFVNSLDASRIAGVNLSGLNDAKVDVITEGSLGVVVSPIRNEKIRPQRKLLSAHQHVVTEIAKNWNALPVAFGLIAESTEDVRSLLIRNAELLNVQITRIQGRVEMFLSIEWTAPNIFQYFVERYPELMGSRDYIASGNASREEQIELGRQFEQAIQSERTKYADIVLEFLAPICQETDIQAQRKEADVVRIACLIERDNERAFTDAVYKAAEKFDEAFRFAFNGPWPPYSFVQLALSME